LVEQLIRNQQVVGSNPTGGSKFLFKPLKGRFRPSFMLLTTEALMTNQLVVAMDGNSGSIVENGGIRISRFPRRIRKTPTRHDGDNGANPAGAADGIVHVGCRE
jgi:hypothetical protein